MRRGICLLLILGLLCIPVKAEGKYVALTFDDGPSGRFTRRLLDGLEQRQVKATFFLCGYRLKDYQGLAERIFQEGHEIDLHGYSHDNMSKMTPAQLEKELQETKKLMPEGCRCTLLRPPGGASSQTLQSITKRENLSVILWSVDPRDWANHDAAVVQASVVERVSDGDIVLLHDMCDCSVDAAFGIIDALQKQGFQFVTVSELARLQGVTLEPGRTYSGFSK